LITGISLADAEAFQIVGEYVEVELANGRRRPLQ
jgi:hypothetical protein